jgi:cell division protein FtsB
MVVVDELRKRARYIAAPVLGACLMGYFCYHLVQGERGLIAWLRLTNEIREAKEQATTVHEEREALERRVSHLRTESLDLDLLDERARATLNVARPDEIVILKR